MASVIVEEIQCYIGLVEKNLQVIESNLALAKSHQENKVFVTINACNQMEDRNNNLLKSQQWLETLLAKMQNATIENKEELQHKIGEEIGILKVFQGLADSGVSTNEKVHKESEVIGNVLYALEGKLLVFQWNDNTARSLFSRVQKRLVTSIFIPFPCALEESNELTCVWVEHCPFWGLAF